MLLACLQIRYKADVNKQAVFKSYLNAYLTDSLQERLTFNITYRSADFSNNYIGITILAYCIYERFDLMGYMWDNLNSLSKLNSPAFLIQYV